MSLSPSSAPSCSACSRLSVQNWTLAPGGPATGRFHGFSPRIARDTLTGIRASDIGKLALEGGGERKAVRTFDFGRSGGEGCGTRLRGAVDDERCAWERLEGGGDAAVGVEVVRPGQAATQGENRVLHRPGFIGANAQVAARTPH